MKADFFLFPSHIVIWGERMYILSILASLQLIFGGYNSIDIYICDENQKPIEYAQLRVQDAQGRLVASEKSNAQGYVAVGQLRKGSYELSVAEVDGYTLNEPVDLEVTSYNERHHVVVSIALEKEKPKTYSVNLAMLILFGLLCGGFFLGTRYVWKVCKKG